MLHHFPTLIFVDKPRVFIKYFPNVLTGSIVQIDVAVSFNKGLTVNGIQDKVLDNFKVLSDLMQVAGGLLQL